MEYIVRYCPKCNGELHIPGNLTECICMYCGENISFKQETVSKNTMSEEELKASYEKAISELGSLFHGHDRIMPQFTNGMYTKSFQEYLKVGEAVLLPVEQYAVASGMSEEIVEKVTDELLSLLVKEINATKIVLGGSTKGRIVEEYRLFLTVYTIPMIRYLKLSVSEALADAIIERWCREYPKFQFSKGSYEDLSSGFKQKLCFITTAVCRTMDKPDDCYELKAFRGFRDDYMSRTKQGKAMIEEYYTIAPAIVAYLKLCTDYRLRYQQLWTNYLLPCLKFIEEGRYTECERTYQQMVCALKEELSFSDNRCNSILEEGVKDGE